MWNNNTPNVGTFGAKPPRYEELAVPKNRIDQTSHDEPFKVKRRALSYRITDSLNKLAQPKRCSPKPKEKETELNTALHSKNFTKDSENVKKMTYYRGRSSAADNESPRSSPINTLNRLTVRDFEKPIYTSCPTVQTSSGLQCLLHQLRLRTQAHLLKTYLQRRCKRQNKTWNSPRKTIKAVDSMGRIEERLNLMEGPKSPRKRNAPNKCKKKMNDHLKRYKRLLELAKPRSVPSKEVDDSVTSLKDRKSCTLKRRVASKLWSNCDKRSSNPTENLACNTAVQTKKPVPVVYRTVTEHMSKLAEPRVRDEMRIRLPGKVLESALFATASKRLIELATPKSSIRSSIPQEDTNKVTRTAFGVSRGALNASCSPRILKLSAPRNPRTLLNRK